MADSEGAVAPAEPASETSPATWRIGRFAVASGLVVSTVAHLLLIAPALILTSRLLQSDPAQSLTVDLVTPEEFAAVSQKAAEPEKPKPPPQPKPPPAAPALSQANPFATPLLPRPPAATDPGPVGLLTRLAGLSPVEQDGGASDVQADLKVDDIRAFAMHVQSCWSAPAGVAKEPRLFVVLRVRLGRDGSLMGDPALVQGFLSPLGPALADGAKRAIRKCMPYAGLPVAKYDEWKALDLRFTPSGLATASTVDRGPGAPGSG